MSKDLNKVLIIGRLGADPEMRFTPQGTPVTTFRVASGRSWKDAGGVMHEETEWFRLVAWNKLAEVCNQYLTKGARVYVEGRLHTRSWQDSETGQDRFLTEVIASDMIMLDSRKVDAAPEAFDPEDAEAETAAPSTSPARRAPASAPTRAAAGKNVSASRAPATPSRGRSRRSAFPEEDLPF